MDKPFRPVHAIRSHYKSPPLATTSLATQPDISVHLTRMHRLSQAENPFQSAILATTPQLVHFLCWMSPLPEHGPKMSNQYLARRCCHSEEAVQHGTYYLVLGHY